MLTTCQNRGIENILPKLAMLHPQFAPLALKDVLEESVQSFNALGAPTAITMTTGTGRSMTAVKIEYFEMSNMQGVRACQKGEPAAYLHFSADKKPRL